jgi:hypothetical protein
MEMVSIACGLKGRGNLLITTESGHFAIETQSFDAFALEEDLNDCRIGEERWLV